MSDNDKMHISITPLPVIAKPKFVDITGADIVDIRIRQDRKVIWITVLQDDHQFSLRVCRIKELDINDDSKPAPPF